MFLLHISKLKYKFYKGLETINNCEWINILSFFCKMQSRLHFFTCLSLLPIKVHSCLSLSGSDWLILPSHGNCLVTGLGFEICSGISYMSWSWKYALQIPGLPSFLLGPRMGDTKEKSWPREGRSCLWMQEEQPTVDSIIFLLYYLQH